MKTMYSYPCWNRVIRLQKTFLYLKLQNKQFSWWLFYWLGFNCILLGVKFEKFMGLARGRSLQWLMQLHPSKSCFSTGHKVKVKIQNKNVVCNIWVLVRFWLKFFIPYYACSVLWSKHYWRPVSCISSFDFINDYSGLHNSLTHQKWNE